MKIIELQSEGGSIYIEVPVIAFGFDVNNYATSSELMYMMPIESMTSEYSDEILITIPLPKGNWKIKHKP